MVRERYKQMEVGVIPEGWDVVLLDSVAKRGSGHTPDKKYPEYWNGSIKWISLKDSDCLDALYIYDTVDKTTPLGIANSSAVIYPAGTVVLSRDAGVGKSAIMGNEMAVSQHFMAWQCSPKLNNRLLYYWLQVKKPEFERIAIGNTIKTIGLPYFKQLKIPLPPPPEQRSISQALSDVDALIAGLDKAIAKKRAIKTATMQQLLTGKKRLPGFGEGKGYQKTAIGVIPEDWHYLPLDKFIVDLRGGAPLKPTDFTKGGVKVLQKGGVVRGGFLTIHEKDLQFCSRSYADKYSKNQVDESYTIVVLRDLVPSGPSIGLIAKIGVPETYVLAQGVYGFKVTEEVIPEYLIQYSNSTPYRRLMNEIMVGSTQVHVTNTAFKSARLPFPKLEEQQAIATVLSDMDAAIAALETRLAKTQALKQGMMQALLTGRVRLV